MVSPNIHYFAVKIQLISLKLQVFYKVTDKKYIYKEKHTLV